MELMDLKGLGEKTIDILNKNKIFNVLDLLEFYPYRYEIICPSLLGITDLNEIVSINVSIVHIEKVVYIKKNLNVLRFKASYMGSLIYVSIFNRAFMKSHLKVGMEVLITGKYNPLNKNFVASKIELNTIDENKIVPIYHAIKGVKPQILTNAILSALDLGFDIDDYIPVEYQKKYGFMPKMEAIRKVHFPNSEDDYKNARYRIIYEELFVFLFKVHYLKLLKEKDEGVNKNISREKIEEFIDELPFKLTNDQYKGIMEGLKDFNSKKKMNRLLLGDVGSGKTIVAITLMYANYLAGYQSAFLVPTEILAKQHFDSIASLLNKYGVRVELIVGSMGKREKQKIYESVSNGDIDILIGTHAILSDNLVFNNLGFIVTDEQHRFGVNQRASLQNKGIKPDVLYMSATPIPRTYALTIYGDMDITYIKEKPSGRLPIITMCKKENEIKECLYKVLEEIKKGHQIYVVSPLINNEDVEGLKDVYVLKEKFDLAFNGRIDIGILHGKMKDTEKEEVMNNFKNGRTKILISTTVIEVGVDVSFATVMIIYNANRFGLATLHQLRGRVGRSGLQSYCYLICNEDVKRLQVMCESNDGFYISEQDFKMRGEGDLFGERQSGDMYFKIANLKNNYDILLTVLADVKKFISTNEFQNLQNFQKIMCQIKFNN